MTRIKILHITSWYPSIDMPKEALWIERHIKALSSYAENTIYHFEIKKSSLFRLAKRKINPLHQTIIFTPWHSWFVSECLHFFWLLYQFAGKRAHRKFDVINFHIAYPMLTYWWLLKPFISKPVIITEHWSAYHFNFGVQGKALPRIQRIFNQNIPVIGISQSLITDIKNFSGANFPAYVVPNVVDERIFFFDSSVIQSNYFFMVSLWKWPKRPLIVLEAFKNICQEYPDTDLIVGGYGPDYSELIEWVESNDLGARIKMAGIMDSHAIADHLRCCKAFIQCSEYETFSVVCAEAISCHTPVIASNVGGISEILQAGEGLLVESNSVENWTNAMRNAMQMTFRFSNSNRFSEKEVGKRYFNALLTGMHETSK